MGADGERDEVDRAGGALLIPPVLVALGSTATLPAGATFGGVGGRAAQAAVLLEGVVVDGGCVVTAPGTLLAADAALGVSGADAIVVRALSPVALLVLSAPDLRGATGDVAVARWLRRQRSVVPAPSGNAPCETLLGNTIERAD